jgi:hypothetical protein
MTVTPLVQSALHGFDLELLDDHLYSKASANLQQSFVSPASLQQHATNGFVYILQSLFFKMESAINWCAM